MCAPTYKAQKNDGRDAEAIAEEATRPTVRFVPLKSEAQLEVQILHRVRERLVGQRPALMNQMRSLLLERGLIVPQGRRKLQDALVELLSMDTALLSARIKRLLGDMQEQRRSLDQRITAFDDEFAALGHSDPTARRLTTFLGIGVLSATALTSPSSTSVSSNASQTPCSARRRKRTQTEFHLPQRSCMPRQG